MIRDVLVHVTADVAGEGRLAYALGLAGLNKARLTGVHVLAPAEVPPMFKVSAVQRVADELLQDERRQTEEAKALFERVTQAAPIEVRWFAPGGGMVEGVCARARYADLVVLGHEPTEVAPQRNPLALAEEVVLKSGRPVLVLPDTPGGPPPHKKALIAWDGSREAVRAIHDALPLLQEAQISLVVVANPEHRHVDPDVVAGDELLDHLRRHGVAVESARTVRLHESEAKAILDYFKHQEADLLVMGAFGHSALREMLLGGATEYLVRANPGALLLSH